MAQVKRELAEEVIADDEVMAREISQSSWVSALREAANVANLPRPRLEDLGDFVFIPRQVLVGSVLLSPFSHIRRH